MIAYQEIPLDDYIEASNALIIDQGVTVFALVVFAVVIFGILWIMYIESKQQSKTLDILMTISKGIGGMETSVNTLAADAKLSKTELIGKAEEISLKSLQSQRDTRLSLNEQKHSIDQQTESVKTMSDQIDQLIQATNELNELKDDVRKMLSKDTMNIPQDTINAIVEAVALRFDTKMETLRQCVETTIKTTQEAPKVEPETPIANETKEETK